MTMTERQKRQMKSYMTPEQKAAVRRIQTAIKSPSYNAMVLRLMKEEAERRGVNWPEEENET